LTDKTKYRKRAIVAVALLLAVGFLLATAGPRLYLLIPLKLSFSRSESPALYRVPDSREISFAAPDKDASKRYSLQDFMFSTPWELLQQMQFENTYAFEFQGGRIMLASFREEDGRLLKTLLKGSPEESREMQTLLGAETIQSEYALVDVCLQATPAQAGVLASVAELTRIRTLLIVKSAFPLGTALYRFRLGNLRGFQFGRPDADPNVFVYLYTSEDRLLRLKFAGLTQPEIDRMLVSLFRADSIRSRSLSSKSGLMRMPPDR